jgi:hypothetical protein
MRSPCCLCVCVSPPPINFWMSKQILMKLGMYIIAPEPISTAYFINPSHQSVCLYVYPHIVARQRQRIHTRIEESGRVVFSAVSVVSKESRRLVLPKTPCCLLSSRLDRLCVPGLFVQWWNGRRVKEPFISIHCPDGKVYGVLPPCLLYLFGTCSTWGRNVNAYKVLFGDSEVKRTLGRPRRRWGNIHLYRRDRWEGVRWVQVALEWVIPVGWGASVDTIMNLRVLKSTECFD